MREVVSTEVMIHLTLPMSNILYLHQFAKAYTGSIYFLNGQVIVNARHLTKMVSFLLTHKSPLTIVVVGHQPQETLLILQKWFQKNTKQVTHQNLTPSLI